MRFFLTIILYFFLFCSFIFSQDISLSKNNTIENELKLKLNSNIQSNSFSFTKYPQNTILKSHIAKIKKIEIFENNILRSSINRNNYLYILSFSKEVIDSYNILVFQGNTSTNGNETQIEFIEYLSFLTSDQPNSVCQTSIEYTKNMNHLILYSSYFYIDEIDFYFDPKGKVIKSTITLYGHPKEIYIGKITESSSSAIDIEYYNNSFNRFRIKVFL